MSFFGDFLTALKAETQQRAQNLSSSSSTGGGGGRGKTPECTPCAANAYVESLRESIRKGDGPKRRRPSKKRK